ncbi:MarR family winged helix-turn-helix transcriptional regulator [Microtetraspora malaysiensis]|uniref:MarR family winged helix-turn-helix transcriptional regulator n=1 Tax=Microtetraspora malaysiensis TaxID=161358 RepID=UPI003D930425
MMTSRVVRTLVERGLVTRYPDASDARTLRLALTPKGHSLTTQAIQAARDLDAQYFEADPDELRATLRDIAQRRGKRD